MFAASRVAPSPTRSVPRAVAPTQKFAVLRRASRIWVVSAIHGEADRLCGLHDALWPRFDAGDRLAYLGNYFGPGRPILGGVHALLRFRPPIIALPLMFPPHPAHLP